jgi:hypothetical protein
MPQVHCQPPSGSVPELWALFARCARPGRDRAKAQAEPEGANSASQDPALHLHHASKLPTPQTLAENFPKISHSDAILLQNADVRLFAK